MVTPFFGHKLLLEIADIVFWFVLESPCMPAASRGDT